ncbi:hypothetical protein ACROYT_G018829 [Oculina patagonica]
MDNSNSTVLEAFRCKPFGSDTAIIKGVKISFYIFLMLSSISGNSLLLAIVTRNKRMQSITNYLIVNMAVSDILITVLAVPRRITEILVGPRRWLVGGSLGSVLCKSISFLQDISTAVSVLSILVIAIDRYRGIVLPFHKQIKKTKLFKCIIPSIWIVSMIMHGSYFYTFRITEIDGRTYCVSSWAPRFDDRKSTETQYLVVLVFVTVIPVCAVTVLYSVIVINLKRGFARCNAYSSQQEPMTARRLKEDSKVVKNLIAIMIAFVVCIAPINVYAILFFFVWDWTIPCNTENFGSAAHFMLYFNASVNPCIYFVFNDKFRQGMLDILKLAVPWKKRKRNLSQPVTLVSLKTFIV